MNNTITIIFILFGIFQLILIAKIWKMTDDVSAIKKIITKEKNIIDTNVSLLIGNKEDIILSRKKTFFTKLTRLKMRVVNNYSKDSAKKHYTKQYAKLVEEYKYLDKYIEFEDYNSLEKFKEATSL